MSLPALFSYALDTVKAHIEEDKHRYVYMTTQDEALARVQIKQAIERVGVIEASFHPDAEKMLLDEVSYIYLLYREYPNYAHILDKLIIESGRELRTLARRKESNKISDLLQRFLQLAWV